jgi:hypothetical protein
VQAITEWHHVDAETFRERIASQYQPAVLRGLVGHWPAVQRARQSPHAITEYLHGFDNGRPVDAVMTRPEERGRIFYSDDFNGFNFLRNKVPVSSVLEQLSRYAAFEHPPAVAVQSALIKDCLPGFLDENRLDIIDPQVAPRIWLGNATTVPAHFDEWDNVACVVGGRRRFTLFPPGQVANLYIGPIDHAPTGAPISMVSLKEPDFERFPRFKDALAAAQVAELEAGDAIFIPTLWWHHVESLAQFNMLVNYWWRPTQQPGQRADSALDCLLHCMLSLRDLPPAHRQAWGEIFKHYIFSPEDAAAHIPEHKRGVLGPISAETAQQMRGFLADKLQG